MPADGLLARITQQLRPKRSPTLIPCWDSDLSPAPSLFLASWVLRCTPTSSRSNSSTPSHSLQPSGHYTYRALPAPHTSPLHLPVFLGLPLVSSIHSLGLLLSHSVPFHNHLVSRLPDYVNKLFATGLTPSSTYQTYETNHELRPDIKTQQQLFYELLLFANF